MHNGTFIFYSKKKKKISQNDHSLSLAVICCHPLSFCCHSRSFVFTCCPSLYYSLSLVVTRRITRLSFYKQAMVAAIGKTFNGYLKLASAIFYQIFIYLQMIVLQKIWKMSFISSKKLFSFSRYLSFCIFVFPSFSPCQPLL